MSDEANIGEMSKINEQFTSGKKILPVRSK